MTFGLTTLGFVVIPLTVALWVCRPQWLLPWAMFLAPLHAASVVNIQVGDYGLGIQPGIIAGFFFVLHSVVAVCSVDRTILRRVSYQYAPLFAFLLYALFSGMVFPFLFKGQVYVMPPREGLGLANLAPLAFRSTNVSQMLYLTFYSILAYLASLMICARASNGLQDGLIGSYIASCLLSGALGVYQVVAWNLGLPFPSDILYSNPNTYQGFDQTIAGIKRLSATFTEPSTASYYFLGFFAFSLALYFQGYQKRMTFLTSVFSVLLLAVTTSSTAYVGMTVVLILAAGLAFIRSLAGRAWALLRISLLVGSILACVGLLLLFFPNSYEAMSTVYEASLGNKVQSVSFVDRSSSDLYALQLMRDTWGLGVGWGSTRASSLWFNLLANSGIPGSLLFALFTWRVMKHAKKHISSLAVESPERTKFQALLASALAMFLAAMMSNPDLTYPGFWLVISLIVGINARPTEVATEPKALLQNRASLSPESREQPILHA